MGVDFDYEQRAIITQMKTRLVGGRVYPWVPDEFVLPTFTDSGVVRPYIVVAFGQPIAMGRDRSLSGEEDQPLTLPVVIECWGSTYDVARKVAGAVRTTLIGFSPSLSAGEVRSASGGGMNTRVTSGAGSRFLETVALQVDLNLGAFEGA